MKKLLIVIALLSLSITTNSWATFVDYNTGVMSNGNGSLLISQGFSGTFIWDVNQGIEADSGTWQYIYTFNGQSGNEKKPTLLDIEVGPGFKIIDPNNNLLSWSADPSMSDPTSVILPAGPSGLQWILTTAGKNISLTLLTNMGPMWGDIYIGGQNNNYAKNSGYGFNNPNPTNGSAIDDGKYFALVPTPIPSAVLLLGSGLIGIVAVRRRFSK